MDLLTKEENPTSNTTTFPQNSVRHPISQTVSYNPKLPETNSKEEIEYTSTSSLLLINHISAKIVQKLFTSHVPNSQNSLLSNPSKPNPPPFGPFSSSKTINLKGKATKK